MADSDDGDRPARLTPAERAQRKRDEKLADMKEQIDSGRLVVRQMSEEDIAAYEKARSERRMGPPGGGRAR